MKLPIVEIVRRDKTFEGIAAFERDALGERDASAKIHQVVIAALRSVVKAVVAEPVLQQDPRRLTAPAEAPTPTVLKESKRSHTSLRKSAPRFSRRSRVS